MIYHKLLEQSMGVTEINAPSENHEDYFNRKQVCSINLQAIVDADLKFIPTSVGYPGSIHDARVLRLSGLILIWHKMSRFLPVQCGISVVQKSGLF